MDASIHDWLEGRGEELVLIAMIDDATSRVEARFYPAGTVETHMELLRIWLRRYGRPLGLYTDRHSIFEPQDKGQALPDGMTQFGRALQELNIELIRARSPQAKGRVERLFGTAQDRWVKEMRLAGVTTAEQANRVVKRLLPEHNRRFSVPPRDARDAHRDLGPEHKLESILSIQEQRVVSNDYTIRLHNRFYQLLKPVYPGERGGRVVIEERLDGSMAIRYREHYLKFRPIAVGDQAKAPDQGELEFSAFAAGASDKKKDREAAKGSRSSGTQPTARRSGRTPAEPYPPDGEKGDTATGPHRPGPNHPWRKLYKRLK
jgi:hypothetical protein